MKFLANRHLFSLIGAVIGVLVSLVFSPTLVQILDWNWKTIAMINLATYLFIIATFVYFLMLKFAYLLIEKELERGVEKEKVEEDAVQGCAAMVFVANTIVLPFLVPGVDFLH